MTDQPEQHEWSEPMPGEGIKAFAAFCQYRDMGPKRTTAKVQETCSSHLRTIQGWSYKFAWVARAMAYDAYIAGAKAETAKDKAVEIVTRHARAGKNMVSVGMRYIIEELHEKVGGLEAMSPAEALRMVIEGAKLERLSSGMSETVEEHRIAGGEGGPLTLIIQALVQMEKEDPDAFDRELNAFAAGADSRRRIEAARSQSSDDD